MTRNPTSNVPSRTHLQPGSLDETADQGLVWPTETWRGEAETLTQIVKGYENVTGVDIQNHQADPCLPVSEIHLDFINIQDKVERG